MQPPKSVPVNAVLFDLDGTLVDTLDDIMSSLNHVLSRRGLAPRSREDCRWLIGDGVAALVRRAAPGVDEQTHAELLMAFREHYMQHLLDRTHAYEGVPELLESLVSDGLELAVLSNKPQPATQQIIDGLFPSVRFADVVGHRRDAPRKPDPTSAVEIAGRCGWEPASVAFVGDTGVDMETARRAGMRPVGVGWGFRSMDELRAHGAEDIVHMPGELREWVQRHRDHRRE